MGGGSPPPPPPPPPPKPKPTTFPASILRSHAVRSDRAGDGRFGASRDGGARVHNGLDLLAAEGDAVFAPFSGRVVRQTNVYTNPKTDCHAKLRGLVVQGAGDWSDFELKLFYLAATLGAGAGFNAGDIIGRMQNVAACSPGSGMLNHLHVEVRKSQSPVDPARYLKW